MNKMFKVAILITIFFADIPLFAAKSITITGSTTVLPIAQRVAEVYMDLHEDVSVSVRGGGSGVGIAALIDGRADIADASRSVKTKELKAAREKGIDPYANIVARDGIAVVVHPDNPINALDMETLKKIYTGEINNWKEVDGPSKPIVVISRDVASGTFEVFNELVLGGVKVKEGALMLASNKAVATTVATTPDGIGYIGLGYLSKEVKALKVNGVMPSNKTVNDGSYKLARPLFMYTNSKPKGVIKSFIDFILSDEGQKIAEEVGYVPIR